MISNDKWFLKFPDTHKWIGHGEHRNIVEHIAIAEFFAQTLASQLIQFSYECSDGIPFEFFLIVVKRYWQKYIDQRIQLHRHIVSDVEWRRFRPKPPHFVLQHGRWFQRTVDDKHRLWLPTIAQIVIDRNQWRRSEFVDFQQETTYCGRTGDRHRHVRADSRHMRPQWWRIQLLPQTTLVQTTQFLERSWRCVVSQ